MAIKTGSQTNIKESKGVFEGERHLYCVSANVVEKVIAPEGYLLNIRALISKSESSSDYLLLKNCALGRERFKQGHPKSLSKLKAMELNGETSKGEIILESYGIGKDIVYKAMPKNHVLVNAAYEFVRSMKEFGNCNPESGSNVHSVSIKPVPRSEDKLRLLVDGVSTLDVSIQELSDSYARGNEVSSSKQDVLNYNTACFIQVTNRKFGEFDRADIQFYGDNMQLLSIKLMESAVNSKFLA